MGKYIDIFCSLERIINLTLLKQFSNTPQTNTCLQGCEMAFRLLQG